MVGEKRENLNFSFFHQPPSIKLQKHTLKMRNTNYLLLTLIAFLFYNPLLWGQKSIKQEQQSTLFLYTQLNLNGGFSEANDYQWMFSQTNPYSNLNFTLRSKNQRLLQKGYVRFLHLSGFKASWALVYKNLNPNEKSRQLDLHIRDIWLKFGTKWDRTSVTIGHFALPYGHAPKMDLDNSFVRTLAAQDFGFNRDLGILFKTPLSSKLDLEAAFTMGGCMPTTGLSWQNLPKDTIYGSGLQVASWDDFGTWLGTFRVGNTTFNQHEFGVFGSIGRLENRTIEGTRKQVFRLGGDWTAKHKEQFRMTNQLIAGWDVWSTGNTMLLFQKTELDYFFLRKFIVSLAHNFQMEWKENTQHFNGTVVISSGYALNPHTRLKMNVYSQYSTLSEGLNPGVFFQLVTGFGRRS